MTTWRPACHRMAASSRRPAGTRVSSSTGAAPGDEAQFSEFFSSLFGGAAAWASAGLPRARRRPPCGDRGGPGGRAAWRHPRHQPALDAHGRSRPTADEHAHLERAHSGGRARRPVHPPGRAGHAGLRRRRERRPVSRSALQATCALSRRGPRPVHVLPVAPWEAALGAQVEAPTPGRGGGVHPRGSANGRKLRLRGRGIPGDPPGDLYLVLELALPPADTEAAKQAYRKMQQDLPFNPRRHLGA